MTAATYVYCVVHREKPLAVRSMPAGIPGGSRPRLLPVFSRFWAVVSQVPAATYSPGQIERRLADLEWVSGIALAHEAVVERLGRVGAVTVIPMKLFTMFSSDERVTSEMRSRQRQLERIVRQISGCEEWGVRVTRGTGARSGAARAPASRSGTAFLEARKQARDAARDQSRRMLDAAAEALNQLSRMARGAKPRPAPEGAAAPPLLDAAFLVPAGERTKFRTAVRQAARRCQEAGAVLTVTGPWPAYHFIEAGGGEA